MVVSWVVKKVEKTVYQLVVKKVEKKVACLADYSAVQMVEKLAVLKVAW